MGAIIGSSFLLALAYVGFLLNLFNLLPVVPLDGGRAMAAMAPWMWFLGFGGLVALVFVYPNPILLIIILFGGMETWRRWQQRKTRSLEQAAYYRVAPRHRMLVGAVYIGLIVALAFGMYETHILVQRRPQLRLDLTPRRTRARRPSPPRFAQPAFHVALGLALADASGACRRGPCRARARSRPWRARLRSRCAWARA